MDKKLRQVERLAPGTRYLDLGLSVNRKSAAGLLNIYWRPNENHSLFATGYISRSWRGDLDYGAMGGWRYRF